MNNLGKECMCVTLDDFEKWTMGLEPTDTDRDGNEQFICGFSGTIIWDVVCERCEVCYGIDCPNSEGSPSKQLGKGASGYDQTTSKYTSY